MKAIVSSPGYRRLWFNAAANAVSYGGDFVLVGWLALTVSGSSAWVGSAFALYYLPKVLLGIFAGSVADRFDRRRLIRFLELGAAALIGLFALLLHGGEARLAEALALALCLGSLRALQAPVRLSFTYDLVGPRNITPALAGMTLATRLGMVAGAPVIGALAETAGAGTTLGLMAAAHLAAWLCLQGRFESAVAAPTESPSVWQNLKDYLRELRVNRLLLALALVTATIEVFGVSLHSVLPELAETRLDLDAQGLGWMQAAQSCGGLVVGGLLFLLPPRRGMVAPYGASLLCLGTALVVLGHVQGLAPTLLALAVIAAMIAAWDIFTQSMMQLSVADNLRGRAMGTWVFAIGSAPLGHLQIGFLAALTSVGTALTLNGLAVIAIIVTALAVTPALRRL